MLSVFLFCIIITFSSFAQGVLGFGSTLFAAPLALMFLDKETVVSSMLIVGIAANSLLVTQIKEAVNKNLILPLACASLIGIPLGTHILQSAPTELMKVVVGILSIIFFLLLLSKKISIANNQWHVWIAGLISGILTTSTSMNGPPIVLLLAGKNMEKDHVRKTLVIFFLFMSLVALILFAHKRILTLERMKFGLFAIPCALLGSYLGNHVSKQVPHYVFKFLMFSLVFLSAAYSIYTGLLTLITR